MERNEISSHEVAVYRVLRQADRWLTNQEIRVLATAAVGSGVSDRTVRLHTKRLARLGLLEVAKLFPGYRYRLSRQVVKQGREYLLRLEEAAAILAP